MKTKGAANPPGRPPKHGARMLGRLIKQNRIDQRTGVAKLLKIQRDLLIADAGGIEHVTNRELLLIERTAALAVLMSGIENWVFSRGSLIDPTDNGLLPPLRKSYLSFANALRLNLDSLGLRPRKPDTPPVPAATQEPPDKEE